MMARLETLIEAHRSGRIPPDESVISGLATAVEAGELEASEAVVHVWQLIQAGTETTSSLIANLLYTLLSKRDRWLLLQQRPELIEAAIEESLRRDSPIQYVMRTPFEPTAVGGCPIEVDEQIVIGLQSANWDPEVWGADALEFDIERDLSAGHLTFGRGAHACLGSCRWPGSRPRRSSASCSGAVRRSHSPTAMCTNSPPSSWCAGRLTWRCTSRAELGTRGARWSAPGGRASRKQDYLADLTLIGKVGWLALAYIITSAAAASGKVRSI